MAYNPATDFLGLVRIIGSSIRSEYMPGLDWVVEALARMGMFSLSVGQTAPTVNQASTFWLKPAQPSWLAEGTLFIWNPVTTRYEQATAALWQAFLSPSGQVFQSLAGANNIILPGVSLAAIQRVAPVNTAVQLPTIAAQFLTQKDILLVDYSTAVANHTITLSTPDGAAIMQIASPPGWQLLSTAAYLSRVRLRPSPDLNAWVLIP